MTTIGNSAFFLCSKLESITIPASVTAIENSAFRACFELTAVTMEATEPPILGTIVFNETADTLQILVPSGFVKEYWEAENWSTYSDKITE